MTTTYEEFREQWMKQHPASVPVLQVVKPKYPRWLKVSVAAMFICAALVSGVHTIPTVRSGIEINEIITPAVRDAVSIGSFIAVEFAILISAYIRSVNRWLSTSSLLVSFTVAVVSNVTSVQRALIGAESGAVTVALVLGVGAPLLALLAGAVFLIIDTESKQEVQEAEQLYRQTSIDFDAKINAAWVKFEKDRADRQALPPPAASAASVSPDTDNRQTRQASYGYVSTPDGQLKVIAHLNERPNDATLGSRALGSLIGVSHDTANKGRQEWQRQRALVASTNGNGHGEVQP